MHEQGHHGHHGMHLSHYGEAMIMILAFPNLARLLVLGFALIMLSGF